MGREDLQFARVLCLVLQNLQEEEARFESGTSDTKSGSLPWVHDYCDYR